MLMRFQRRSSVTDPYDPRRDTKDTNKIWFSCRFVPLRGFFALFSRSLPAAQRQDRCLGPAQQPQRHAAQATRNIQHHCADLIQSHHVA